VTATDAIAGLGEGFDLNEIIDLDVQAPADDPVRSYLNAIAKRALLTAEQEVDLAKRIEAGLFAEYKLANEANLASEREDLERIAEDGRRAKSHMLEANLRLVVSMAKRYKERDDKGLALLDIIQEGNLGLIRAVEKFDYTKGYKFSTYAMWWIRQAIQRGIADAARTIRLPINLHELVGKLRRVKRQLVQDLGREPTDEETAKELDITLDQLAQVEQVGRPILSLDLEGDHGFVFGDNLRDESDPSVAQLVIAGIVSGGLGKVLESLSDRDQLIMEMRFGFFSGSPMSCRDVAKRIGLSRERIRQIEKICLAKLSHPSNSGRLLELWAS